MSIGELQKFASFFFFFSWSQDEERVKEFIQSILLASKSETVNPAKLRKDKWGTTLIPAHAKRNWCHIQSSNSFFKEKNFERFQCRCKCFSELMIRKLEHLKLCLEMDLIT